MKTLSIVIPTLNAAGTLRACLSSITPQLSDSVELLIVDGGSTDGSQAIAGEYLVDAPGSTIYGAMNYGIEHSAGEYLYFIGADDTLVDDAVEAMCAQTDSLVWGRAYQAFDFPTHNIRQQSYLYHRSLFEAHGLFDLEHPVYADLWFKKRMSDVGISPVKIMAPFARIAAGGFSSRTKDLMPPSIS